MKIVIYTLAMAVVVHGSKFMRPGSYFKERRQPFIYGNRIQGITRNIALNEDLLGNLNV